MVMSHLVFSVWIPLAVILRTPKHTSFELQWHHLAEDIFQGVVGKILALPPSCRLQWHFPPSHCYRIIIDVTLCSLQVDFLLITLTVGVLTIKFEG